MRIAEFLSFLACNKQDNAVQISPLFMFRLHETMFNR